MVFSRQELREGVFLTAVATDKFKTGLLSVSLLSQLTAENAAMNALIPQVLRRGTVGCPDMEALSGAMDWLYGSSVSPVVRRVGEVQAAGLYGVAPEDAFLPGGERVLERFVALMGEMLLCPNTRGGLLLPDYVEGEKQKLIERIRSRVNDKGSYALTRLIENMCCYEDFAVYKLGDEEHAEAINYKRLTRHYRDALSSSPIELFYCGRTEPDRLRPLLADALSALPRGQICWDIGTDVRMNSVEEEPRSFTEELDVGQGKLAMGWRLGGSMEEPDYAALKVFNAVFGGSVTSKLFMNVRERLSLCYYASSAVDVHKGLLLVSSGIEFDKYDQAREEICAQLAAVARGEISDGELEGARRSVASELRGVSDDQYSLENYWLGMNLDGADCSPEELAVLCESVRRDQVAEIAGKCQLDAVYFLRGEEGSDNGR